MVKLPQLLETLLADPKAFSCTNLKIKEDSFFWALPDQCHSVLFSFCCPVVHQIVGSYLLILMVVSLERFCRACHLSSFWKAGER